MKISYIFLALCYSGAGAQTITVTQSASLATTTIITTTETVTQTAATSRNDSIAQSAALTVVSVWLNISSGALVSATPEGNICSTTELVLECLNQERCGNLYDGYALYKYGSGFFGSEYGGGDTDLIEGFYTTQSCTLVGASGSGGMSYFSCRGTYVTSSLISSVSRTTSVSSDTFTWPTADMVFTGLSITTDLPLLAGTSTASCPTTTTTSAANKAAGTSTAALRSLFGIILLVAMLL